MQILLFGVWDAPISDYIYFYLALALVGFLAGLWKRWLIVFPIGAIIWFGIRDFQDFYRWNVNPPEWYVWGVSVCIAFAIIASIFGAVVGSIKREPATV